MTICTKGPSAGRPNHLAPRYSAKAQQAAVAAEIVQQRRRQVLAHWEAEWIADGTLPGPNWLYQPVDERGENIGAPCDFISAMMAIWLAPWTTEPDEDKRIDPVGPAAAAATEAAGI